MFRMNKRMTALLMVVLIVASLAPTAGAQERDTLVFRSGPTDIPTLDPSIAKDSQSLDILDEIFVGLGRQNEVTTETEPGTATWTVEEGADNLIFTFTLMQGIPWVKYDAEAGEVVQVTDDAGNVRYLTAYDVEYSMLRTLDPATASEYAYVLAGAVKGGQDYNTADPSALSAEEMQALRDAVAVEAVDDSTLRVESATKASFHTLQIAGMWFGYGQPSWLIEEVGDFWSEPENIQTYGPYAVEFWYHDDSIGLIANPFWPGTDTVPKPQIQHLVGVILDDTPAFANYEAGTVDLTDPPLAELDRIKADPVLSEELYIGTLFCTYYYGFNVTKAPVDNVHLRRALSYAVDRQTLIDNVTKGGQIPARWFSRPGLAAAPTPEQYPDLGIGYDPAKAQEELALALEEMDLADVSALPPITLMHNTLESHARIAEAIQQMWAKELGIEVQITNQEWGVYLSTLEEDPPQIWRLGWCLDYPDAHNFASEVFRSDSGNNHTRLVDPEYDALVDRAAYELTDLAERTAVYAEAEQRLIYENAAIIPIYWYTELDMTKPYINRTFGVTGREHYEKWSFSE